MKNREIVSDRFECDGAIYAVTSEATVELRRATGHGAINVPAMVSFKDTTYTVTSIGDYAYHAWRYATSIYIPDSIISIGARAFEMYEMLDFVSIPSSVTSIAKSAFRLCQPKKIYLSEENNSFDLLEGLLVSKDLSALIMCELSLAGTCSIPNGVTEIPDYFFAQRIYLKKVLIPNTTKSIGDAAFMLCESLQSVLIPEGVESIRQDAFICCDLDEVVIPSSVTMIGEGAFMWNKRLEYEGHIVSNGDNLCQTIYSKKE